MKKLKRFSVFIIAFFLLIAMPVSFTLPTDAASTEGYGYELLTNDQQRSAYAAIADGVAALLPEIKFTVPGITPEDVRIAGNMMLRDHPEFFWYDGAAQISLLGDEVTLTPEGYQVGGQAVTAGSQALVTAKNQLEAAISRAVALLPKNPSNYDIAHTFHDFVVNNVSYEMVGDHQTAYGALVNGKAVCAGYTRAFQLLMKRAGIRCFYVAGESYDPAGNLIAHAWNLYWLDGKCYYSDATWDDQGTELFHEYLNMSLEQIRYTHFTQDKLPSPCDHDDYTFFIQNNGNGVCDIRDHKDAKDVAKCFRLKEQSGNQVTYYCTIHYHADDFQTWINSNIRTILSELGMTTLDSNSIILLGHEYHVTLTGQKQTGSGSNGGTVQPPVNTEPTETTQPPQTPDQTEPTQPAPDTDLTQPTEPSGSTEATEQTQPVTEPDPTETTGSPQQTDPSEPAKDPEETTGTKPSEPTQEPSESTGSTPEEPSGSTGTPAPTVTEGTVSTPDQDPKEENDSGSTFMLTALAVVGAAGVAAVAFFFILKKKS